MFEAFATRHNRNRTAVWIAVCCILSAAAAIEGISDNLPGILLAFGAAIALVLAFVHPWRSATKFRNLLFGSAAALVVSGLLHNVFDAVAGQVEGTALLQVPLQGLRSGDPPDCHPDLPSSNLGWPRWLGCDVHSKPMMSAPIPSANRISPRSTYGSNSRWSGLRARPVR